MSVPSGAKADSTHTQHEDNPWTINIVDHPGRAESHWFSASKRAVKKILATLDKSTYPYGPEPWQMHHGGSIWVLTDAGWRMYLARAGIEWSMQFCADPAKIDRLRQEARALVEAFPRTIPALEELGYTDAKAILEDTISDADGVGRYTDSLFNSCVPRVPAITRAPCRRPPASTTTRSPSRPGTSSDTTTSCSGSRSMTAPTRRSRRSRAEAHTTAASSFSTPGTERTPARRSPRRSRPTSQ